jgi:uncharacterized membrane protein YfcA
VLAAASPGVVVVPLFALPMPVEVAVPVAVLLSITVAGAVVIQDWHKIHVRSAGWLLLFTLFGIPVGLLLLTTVAEALVKALLAVVVIAFSKGRQLPPRIPRPPIRPAPYIFR